jgi:hypothetical protein
MKSKNFNIVDMVDVNRLSTTKEENFGIDLPIRRTPRGRGKKKVNPTLALPLFVLTSPALAGCW